MRLRRWGADANGGGATTVSSTDRDGVIVSLLSHVPVEAAAKDRLVALMSGPDRFYHGLDHLATLWTRHLALSQGSDLERPERRVLFACAIAFHDAIYDARRTDNERESAMLWRESAQGRVAAGARDWVANAILASADHLGYRPDDAVSGVAGAALRTDAERETLWFLDLDLTPLGESPDDFDRNTELLRREHPHLEPARFDDLRAGFLERIWRAPVLYRSERIRAAFERRARDNIRRELLRLSRPL